MAGQSVAVAVVAIKASSTCARSHDLLGWLRLPHPGEERLDLYATRRVNCMTKGNGGHF